MPKSFPGGSRSSVHADRPRPLPMRLVSGLLLGLAFTLFFTMGGGAAAQAAPSATTITFESGSLIIPMDADTGGNHAAYNQNLGMWKAYGLLYRLLSNGVPVYWAEDVSKTSSNTVDFSASAVKDLRTDTNLSSWDYRGGPFVIAAADAARAKSIIQAWWGQQGNQPNVHQATASFTAGVPITLRSAPRIAQESTNASIAMAYYNVAGIPDLNGNPWSSTSPNILTQTQIADGGLFENGSKCLRRRFDTFVTPHNGGYSYSLTDATNLGTRTYAQLDTFVNQGGGWTAMCHSILSNENALANLTVNGSPAVKSLFATSKPGGQPGGFLTANGFPSITNGGGTWALQPNAAKLPIAQMVPTTVAPALPGGSVQTWPSTGAGAPTYFGQTERVASFTSGSVVSDQIIAGSYHNGTGAGKVAYIGGHSYSTAVPFTTNTEAPYLKAFYNSLFFNGIAASKMDLIPSRTTFPEGTTGTVTLRLTNVGGSTATSVSNASVVLEPGFSYVNTVSGPAPTVSGQTLTWPNLGDVASDQSAFEITVSVPSSTAGKKTIANFQANYGDVFGEGFTANACQELTIAPSPAPKLTKTPSSQGPLHPGDKVTWTLTYGNTGAADLTNGVVNDTLPAGFTYVSSTSTPSLAAPTVIPGTRTQVRWTVGKINANTANAGTITVVARVGSLTAASPQTVTNEAVLTGTDAGGTELSATAKADVILEQPTLTLDKSVNKTYLKPPGDATYTLIPRQAGAGALANVRVFDPLPVGADDPPKSIGQGGTFGDYVPIPGVPGHDDGPPVLDDEIVVSKTFANQGTDVTVTVKVWSNTAVSSVSPTLTATGGSVNCSGPSPTSANVPNTGSKVSFTYTCTMTDQGEITFEADALGAGDVGWPTATSDSVLVAATGGPKVVTWNLGDTTAAVPGQTITSGYSPGVYELRGATTNVFRKYDTDTSSWSDKANTLVNVAAGGALTNDGAGTIYALAGNNSQRFYSYSANTNTWTLLTDTGTNVNDGGALQFMNVGGTKYVYALMGNGTGFRRYAVAGNSWTGMANLPGSAKQGASLTTDGTYIYAVRGNRQKNLYRYDIGANSWSSMTLAPNNIGAGAGSARIGNFIYVTRGDGKKDFYRYSISGNSWSTMTAAPGNITNGGDMATDGTLIYVLQGGGTIFEQYDPATNKWTKLAPTTGNTGVGAALTYMPGVPLQGHFTSLKIDNSMVSTDDILTATVTFTDSSAVNNVTPGTLTAVGTNGASCSATTGPTLTSANNNITGTGDPVTYTWTCKVAPGTNPGSLKFTVNGSGSGSVAFPTATSNSAIVAPPLTFTVGIADSTPDPVVNGGIVATDDKSSPSQLVNVNTGLPKLAITKINDPTEAETDAEPLRPGDTVTYTMEIENQGTTPATGVTVVDSLPNKLSYSACTGGTSCTATGNDVTWQLPDLNPGDSQIITATGIVRPDLTVSATPYTITNKATADSNETSPTDSNEVINKIQVEPEIVKSVDKAFAGTGDTLTYTITVTNPGAPFDPETGITDNIPTGTSFAGVENCNPECTFSSGKVTFSFSDPENLIPSGVSTYTFQVTVTATGGTEVENTAILAPGKPLEKESNKAVTEIGPSLDVVKTNDPSGEVKTGDTITYTLVVTNESAVPAEKTVLTDAVPTGTVFTSCTTGVGTCSQADGSVTWNLGTVGAKATVIVTWTATVGDVPAGQFQIANQAGVSSDNAPEKKQSNYTYNVLPVPDLSLTKSASPETYTKKGDEIEYTYVVTNNTGSSISGPVTVTDDKTTVTCPAGNLPAYGSIECTATYTITTADVNAGAVTNVAQAHTSTKDSNTAEATVTREGGTGALDVVKTASPSSFTKAGQRIVYTAVATNTGNVTLHDVSIAENNQAVTGWSCTPSSPATLQPGETMTCTGEYITTQADVNAGETSNTVTASGKDPKNNPVSKEGGVDVPGPTPNPQLSVVKSASPSAFTNAGKTITYTAVATNTGNVTLHDVSVVDGNPGVTDWTCTPQTSTLAPGESITCTGKYLTTQADVDAGKTTNAVTASGKDPKDNPVDGTDEIDVPGPSEDPAIAVTKTAFPTSFTRPGETITYTVTATNIGPSTLTEVEVADQGITLSCRPRTPATLAPGASVTCTGDYVTTQADVDAGKTSNAATATGKGPGGQEVDGTDEIDVPGPNAAPGLSLEKSASPDSFTAVGRKITYTVTARNTGNVTLHDVTVTDDQTLANWVCDPSGSVTLAPGEIIQCTGEYTTEQADLDRGYVENSATATGKDPKDNSVDGDAKIVVPGSDPVPGIAVVKTSEPTAFDAQTTSLTYTAVATNTGNVTLTDVVVEDTNVLVTGWTCTWPGTSGKLLPGQSVSCSGTYPIQPADITAGKTTNTVTAEGKGSGGKVVDDEDTIEVPGPDPVSPAIAVVKSSSPTVFTGAKEDIEYTVVATNVGTADLTEVTVVDGQTLEGWTCTWPAAPGSLLVGESVSCTGTYTTTQADVDAGKTTNAVTATGKNGATTVTDTDTIDVPGPEPVPALEVVKTSSPTSFSAAGDKITYTVVTTNTGNVTLTDVEVADDNPDVTNWSCTPQTSTLAPSASITCTGHYVIKQSDVNQGYAANSATATGKDPSGKPIKGKDSTELPGPGPAPGLTVVKSASPATFTTMGQTITYTVRTTNTGNVTLTDVDVTDDNPDVKNWTCDPQSPTTLQPNEVIVCTGTYVTTQADVNAGMTSNTARAAGKDPSNTPVRGQDKTDVPGPDPAPGLSVIKTASPTAFTKAGETITYSAEITNTGNVTLSDVEAVDNNPGVSGWACEPASPATLKPGETMICTGEYVTTQADMDAGKTSNTVTASGTDPNGKPIDKEGGTDVPGPSPTPDLAVVKTAYPASFTETGEQITYTVVATNIGPVTLTDVQIQDGNPDVKGWSCIPTAPATLAPGKALTCRGTYVTTQADVDAGKTSNAATASGKGPDGTPIEKQTDIDVPGPKPASGLSVVKTASPSSFTAKNRTITYTVIAKNIGNVTLTDVTVTDDQQLDNWSCTPSTPATLVPGDIIRCTGEYTTTQADVNAGRVTNAASASGKDPNNKSVEGDGDIVVPGPTHVPGLAVVKSSEPTAFTKAGETLTYTIVATNTGNVTLTNVTITDPGVTLGSCPAVTLAPGESVECTGTYVTTSGDVAAGKTTNTATAQGADPGGNKKKDTTTIDVPGPAAAPKLSVVKSAEPTVFTKAGQTITYTVVATNTGNVPLTDVVVTDDQTLKNWTCTKHSGDTETALDPADDPVTLNPIDTPNPGDPAEYISCTGDYETTQADVNAGRTLNSASATGKNGSSTIDGTDEIDVPGPEPVPALEVVKTSSPKRFQTVGDVITYTVVATNTGNVTLTDVTVTDDNPDVTDWNCELTPPTRPSGPVGQAPTVLSPGESITCTGKYVAKQSDVNQGYAANSATATGKDPSQNPINGKGGTEVPGPIQNPELTLVKTTSPKAFTSAGEKLTVTVVATNTGNVTLSDVIVQDNRKDVTNWSCSPATPATVAPGDKVTCTGTYTTTQADVTRGMVVNTAQATGSSPGGKEHKQRTVDDVPGDTPTPPTPGEGADLSIKKTNNGPATVDGKARFKLLITNNGPDAAENVSISDTLPKGLTYLSAEGSGWTCSNSGQKATCTLTGSLAPGASTSVMIFVRAKVGARPSVKNTATVTSTTTDPNPSNNSSTSKLRVDKLPQKTVKPNKVTKKPGKLVLNPGVTNADRQVRVRVRCRPVVASAAGETRYWCKVKRINGRIVVKARGSGKYRVSVVYHAKGTPKYRPYRQVKTYIIRGKG